jgi:hypothetical protein
VVALVFGERQYAAIIDLGGSGGRSHGDKA